MTDDQIITALMAENDTLSEGAARQALETVRRLDWQWRPIEEAPKDVIIAAREANALVYDRRGLDKSARHCRSGELDDTPLMIGTCDAILAEQERCARIAKDAALMAGNEGCTIAYLIVEAIGAPKETDR